LPEEVGQNRGECVCRNLIEMNSDVKGNALVANPYEKCKDEAFLKQFNLVIANELVNGQGCLPLTEICEKNGIPCILLNTLGFIGKIRISSGMHTIF
jgi:hypothetical protein